MHTIHHILVNSIRICTFARKNNIYLRFGKQGLINVMLTPAYSLISIGFLKKKHSFSIAKIMLYIVNYFVCSNLLSSLFVMTQTGD